MPDFGSSPPEHPGSPGEEDRNRSSSPQGGNSYQCRRAKSQRVVAMKERIVEAIRPIVKIAPAKGIIPPARITGAHED